MNADITARELGKLDKNTYLLIDIRDSTAFELGHIDGAVNIPQNEFEEKKSTFPKDKDIIVCCKSGIISRDFADELCDEGYSAANLAGGYVQWLAEKLEHENRAEEIEKSIRKKFHRSIFSKFARAINEYELIKPGDKIAVCISGGKDSMLMAKLFQELSRHGKKNFEVVFLVMNPGYNEINYQTIKDNAKILNVPITVFEADIFNSVAAEEQSPCYLCARMRRGYLYSHAKELGCNKIALGHHFDDVIETILMGMFYGGKVETMMPKLHSQNFEGMELIRPMYLIKEDDIIAWRDYNQLNFIQCACRFTENCVSCGGGRGSKRDEMKELIKEFRKQGDIIEKNIFRSVHNVNLRTIIGYHKDDMEYNFLDDYNERGK